MRIRFPSIPGTLASTDDVDDDTLGIEMDAHSESASPVRKAGRPAAQPAAVRPTTQISSQLAVGSGRSTGSRSRRLDSPVAARIAVITKNGSLGETDKVATHSGIAPTSGTPVTGLSQLGTALPTSSLPSEGTVYPPPPKLERSRRGESIAGAARVGAQASSIRVGAGVSTGAASIARVGAGVLAGVGAVEIGIVPPVTTSPAFSSRRRGSSEGPVSTPLWWPSMWQRYVSLYIRPCVLDLTCNPCSFSHSTTE